MDAKSTIEYWEGYKEGKKQGLDTGYDAGKEAGVREVIMEVKDYLIEMDRAEERAKWIERYLEKLVKGGKAS